MYIPPNNYSGNTDFDLEPNLHEFYTIDDINTVVSRKKMVLKWLKHPKIILISSILIGLLFGFLFQFTGLWLGLIKLLCLSLIYFILCRNIGLKSAFILSWSFGTAATVTGMGWLLTAMHTIAGLPILIAMLALLLFSLLLGAFNGIAGLSFEWLKRKTHRFTIPFVTTWTLGEWLRTWVLTGMPWMTTGYGFLDTPLTGIAPVLGVLGVSTASILLSVCIVRLTIGEPFETALNKFSLFNSARPDSIPNYFKQLKRFKREHVSLLILFIAMLCIYSGKYPHTHPYGNPLTVSLLQGNIPQRLKFDPDSLKKHMALYADLAISKPADLIVMPETAFPHWDQVPLELFDRLKKIPGTLIVGNIGKTIEGYTNRLEAPFILNTDINKPIRSKQKIFNTQYKPWVYDKYHLVPFGEYIPPGMDWFIHMMSIPLSNLTTGYSQSRPLNVNGLNIAANICYEEIFPHEWKKRAAKAHILLNASNFGWYGNSSVFNQHINIAKMRSLEFQKPYLSATNNGATLFANYDGTVTVATTNTLLLLSGTVQGRSGMTPYAIWGDWGIVVLMFGLLISSLLFSRR